MTRAVFGNNSDTSVPLCPCRRNFHGDFWTKGEALLIMKTEEAHLEEVIERVTQAHPYTVPEVIALPVVAGAEPYLRWVREATGSDNLTS